MKVTKSVAGIGALSLLIGMFFFGACERNITQVVQDTTPLSCFGCHSDVDTLGLVTAEGQWENSKHASGETTLESDGSCAGCHTSQGFVAKIEGHPVDVVERASAINCFTCHAPHSNGNFDIRVTEAWTLENGVSYDLNSGNLCVSCHHSRRNVNTYVKDNVVMTSRFGPHHGPQGDVLIGTGGYEYDGTTYTSSFHRSLTDNGCLDCHMAQNNYFLGGHSFNMKHGEGEDEEYNVLGCDVDDCHGGEIEDLDDGFNRLVSGTSTGVQDSVLTLVETLKGLLQDANLLTSGGVPKARKVATADSAGAVYNYVLVAIEDRSKGIHNTDYIMGLLNSSIQFMTPPTVNSPPAEGTAVSRR